MQIQNTQPITLTELSLLTVDKWRENILARIADGATLAALFSSQQEDSFHLYAVMSGSKSLHLYRTALSGASPAYPALTRDTHQAHYFERELHELTGITPLGYPKEWLKPVRQNAGGMDFYRIDGEEINEVAVGPVHAGIIEPGHFRFQCNGEEVYHLEIALGYQHRGIENALVNGPDKKSLHYMETLAGDTTVGHSLTYCQAVEALAGIQVQPRASALRVVALELERLANHIGDLGALAGDVGYLPTAAFCGRLRGDYLNLTAELCGSRLGRGMICPGGVGFDLPEKRIAAFRSRLVTALKESRQAADLLWLTPSVMARFEGVGIVTQKTARDVGLVGPPARASGLLRDIRSHYPTGAYNTVRITAASRTSGDVFARAFIRWLEVEDSVRIIHQMLDALQEDSAFQTFVPPPAAPGPVSLAPETICISLIEGWRGKICHALITDSQGKFVTYKVVDPSFHNWFGLAMALRNQQISDFPLCNKSFNLSYCGHDL